MREKNWRQFALDHGQLSDLTILRRFASLMRMRQHIAVDFMVNGVQYHERDSD